MLLKILIKNTVFIQRIKIRSINIKNKRNGAHTRGGTYPLERQTCRFL